MAKSLASRTASGVATRTKRVFRKAAKTANKRAGRKTGKARVSKQWAIYTYIAGDNNLSDNGLIDITEMEAAGSSKDVHVAVQIDTAGEHTGSVRYEISEPDFQGKSHRVVIERLPEQNTGSPRFLAEFAQWAADRYPAKQRLLVMWNHGAGFMHTPTRDIGYDDSSRGDALTMGELRWALEQTGFGKKKYGKLKVLGFDACLMNMVEVAYEFSGISDFIVGSQQTEPGDGWPYHDVVAAMRDNPKTETMITSIVDKYIAAYKRTGEVGVTQSALDLNQLPSLGRAVDKLGGLLHASLGTYKARLLEARVKTQGYEEPTYVDLVDLVKHIAAAIPDKKVKDSCKAVTSAVTGAVVRSKYYGNSVSRSRGLSIWFPLLRTDYVTRRSEYVALRYSTDYPKWTALLDTLLSV